MRGASNASAPDCPSSAPRGGSPYCGSQRQPLQKPEPYTRGRYCALALESCRRRARRGPLLRRGRVHDPGFRRFRSTCTVTSRRAFHRRDRIRCGPDKAPRPELDAHANPLAPGMLSKHYSPRTPFIFGPRALSEIAHYSRIGLLCLQPPVDPGPFTAVEILSASGDLREAAANLFSAMRRLDDLRLDVILALPLPERGLGVAVNDRLLRASHSEDIE